MDHKIVCWGDYAIPVPLWANWISWDEDGTITVFRTKPNRYNGCWQLMGYEIFSRAGEENRKFRTSIIPPNPGPWTEQVYWIGD